MYTGAIPVGTCIQYGKMDGGPSGRYDGPKEWVMCTAGEDVETYTSLNAWAKAASGYNTINAWIHVYYLADSERGIWHLMDATRVIKPDGALDIKPAQRYGIQHGMDASYFAKMDDDDEPCSCALCKPPAAPKTFKIKPRQPAAAPTPAPAPATKTFKIKPKRKQIEIDGDPYLIEASTNKVFYLDGDYVGVYDKELDMIVAGDGHKEEAGDPEYDSDAY